MPQITPPSPEASSLFKFNEIPVSLYNGLHNTSIPLLEISSGEVTIPISLQYHSRGVQVNEIASWVGTGWALNYGGMISRQIRGLADETTYGYFSNANSTASYYSCENTRIQELLDETSANHSENSEYDYFPDKFMISTNFFNGEFYYDKNNSDFITQKFSDIKIDSNGDISEFQVTDNAGNKYFFGGIENSGTEFVNENERVLNTFISNNDGLTSSVGINTGYNPYSSWFLRKIITRTNEIIDFIYESEITTFYRRTGDTDEYTTKVSLDSGGVIYVTTPISCHFSKIQSFQKRLSEIRFNGGIVKFESEDRLDVEGGYRLDTIKLFDNKGNCLKQIKLNYEYTTSEINNHIHFTSALLNDEYAKKRLFLKSINFKNALGTSVEKSYSFDYDSQILPSRHSNSIDFWGYYNGKNRGNFINYSSIDHMKATVDPLKVQAGLLKKITYPTGGYTMFEYEPNKVINNLFVRPLQNYFTHSTYSHPYKLTIPNTNPVVFNSEILSYIEPNRYNFSTLRYEKPLVVSENRSTPLIINISPVDFDFTCQLINLDPQGQNYNIGITSGQFTFPDIQPGSYILVFNPNDPYWNPYPNDDLENTIAHSFIVTATWYEKLDPELVYAPGNRIKKITNYSQDSKIEFSKFYTYKDESINGSLTSGILLSSSNYRVILYKIGHLNIYDNFQHYNSGLFGSYTKDNFGYSAVNEYFLDENSNIKDKIEYKYSLNQFQDLGSYFKFPFHPVSDNEWLRGLELKKIYFKNEDNIFKKIKEIKSDYILNDSILISYNHPSYLVGLVPFGIEIEKPKATNLLANPYLRNRTQFCYPNSTFTNLNHYIPNSILEVGYRTSFFTGGTLDLKSTKVTDYFDDNTTVESLTTYTYDYDHHYNVSSSKITTSNNEELETKYYYAPNLQSNINDSLVSKNIVGIPLKTEVKKDGELLSTQETLYKNWGNNLMAPEIIKIAKGNLPSEERIKYKKIDAKSNPLEIEQVDGIHICYIWGYNQTQPIAKIENATYAQVEQYVANLQSLSNGTNEAALLSDLNDLRTALPNAMVTTYTYKPLIGISTVTDPKGDTQTYHYDSFNRLQYVKDKDGNILSENQYHYRTQN